MAVRDYSLYAIACFDDSGNNGGGGNNANNGGTGDQGANGGSSAQGTGNNPGSGGGDSSGGFGGTVGGNNPFSILPGSLQAAIAKRGEPWIKRGRISRTGVRRI